jgi:hypothetical protein
MRYPSQAEYYREQASRVRKRADLAITREARASLLDFADRWEMLAFRAEPNGAAMNWVGEHRFL